MRWPYLLKLNFIDKKNDLKISGWINLVNYTVLHCATFLFKDGTIAFLVMPFWHILLILVDFLVNYVIKMKRSQMKPDGKAKDNKKKRDGICHKLEL